jgi:hypothetical protein
VLAKYGRLSHFLVRESVKKLAQLVGVKVLHGEERKMLLH